MQKVSEKCGCLDKHVPESWPYMVGNPDCQHLFPIGYLHLTDTRPKAELETIDENIRKAVAAACEGRSFNEMPEIVSNLLVILRRILRAHDARATSEAVEVCARDMTFSQLMVNLTKGIEDILIQALMQALDPCIMNAYKGSFGSDLGGGPERERRHEMRDVIHAKLLCFYCSFNAMLSKEINDEKEAKSLAQEISYPSTGPNDSRNWCIVTNRMAGLTAEDSRVVEMFSDVARIKTVHQAQLYQETITQERNIRVEQQRRKAYGEVDTAMDSKIHAALSAIGSGVNALMPDFAPQSPRPGASSPTQLKRTKTDEMLVADADDDDCDHLYEETERRGMVSLAVLTQRYHSHRLVMIQKQRAIKERAAQSDYVLEAAFDSVDEDGVLMVEKILFDYFSAIAIQINDGFKAANRIYSVEAGSRAAERIYSEYRWDQSGTGSTVEESMRPRDRMLANADKVVRQQVFGVDSALDDAEGDEIGVTSPSTGIQPIIRMNSIGPGEVEMMDLVSNGIPDLERKGSKNYSNVMDSQGVPDLERTKSKTYSDDMDQAPEWQPRGVHARRPD